MEDGSTVLDLDQIQGNILAGFNKDFATFLLLKLPSEASAARAWLDEVRVEVATTAEVKAFNDLFSRIKLKYGREGAVQATWMNLALTADGMRALGVPGEELGQFPGDFLEGMRARADSIGDVGPNAPGQWPIGLGTASIDALMIVASDTDHERDRVVGHFVRQAARHGVTVVFQQDGMTRRDDPGHEHFGFKDGISQPGVLGFTDPDPNDPTKGKPGQDLLQPGEFVLGYPRQAPPVPEVGQYPSQPANDDPHPAWTRNGSFLVFRRLAQDVPGFHEFVQANAGPTGLCEDLLGAKLVGRYATGAPLARANNDCIDPGRADPSVLDDSVINDFDYSQDDAEGDKTPRASHIRKAYPRDQQPPGEVEGERRRIMRRGIPFGHSFHRGAHPTSEYGALTTFPHDRGLCFVCYQSSISNQFEFIQSRWVNPVDFPQEGDGQDPVISQADETRTMRIPGSLIDPLESIPRWVTTTVGEYFFSPSLDCLARLANGAIQEADSNG